MKSNRPPGRPSLGVRPIRLSLDQPTLDRLARIDKNLSAAVRAAAEYYERNTKMMLRSHTIPQLWTALGEGYRLYNLDTGTDGADDVLYGLDLTEIAHDVILHHDLDELPDHWRIDEISAGDVAGYGYEIRTPLATLREFPGWQDAGQLGDDAGLTNDTLVSIAADGSVSTCDGTLCDAAAEYPLTPSMMEWYRWIGVKFSN